MAENSSLMGGEQSFFADRSFNYTEKGKSQKDVTKNSSNAEKIYETYNLEINKVTGQTNQNELTKIDMIELNNSNKTIELSYNEQLDDPKIWKEKKSTPQDLTQYITKYNLLKKQTKGIPKPKKKIIQRITNPTYEPSADIEDECDEKTLINKVSSISIKTNNFTKEEDVEENNNNSRIICITEPDDGYMQRRPYFAESIKMSQSNNNTPQQYKTIDNNNINNTNNMYVTHQTNLLHQFQAMSYQHYNHGSFASTNYSNNKMQTSNEFSGDYDDMDINENTDGIMYGSNNTAYTSRPYCVRIPTNESVESMKPIRHNQPQNGPLLQWPDPNDRKIYSFSFNETSYYQNYYPRAMIAANSNITNTSFNTKNEKKQLINLEDILTGKDNRTTVMIRNVPIKYTDDMLIQELKEFEHKYDCLYMPFDFENKGNKGYAFINFTHPLHILLFHEVFEGKSWIYFESKKICELNSANFQGTAEIKKHAKNYKGIRKPLFFLTTEEIKTPIEIPEKYLPKLQSCYPNLTYNEKRPNKTIIIKSLT